VMVENNFWRVTPTLDGAYSDMLALLESGRKPPTAFFAGNDIMAVGCMRALSEKGYAAPRDVSMIGMDDVKLCQFQMPSLTSIKVFRQEMGIVAVRTLLQIASDRNLKCAVKIEMDVELVKRESVVAPRVDA